MAATDDRQTQEPQAEGDAKLPEDPDEEEEEDATSVVIAATLMAAITFMMTLSYLINHSDEDIRRSTYEVLSMTISIFSAVFIFQLFDELLEENMNGISKGAKVAVDFFHMVLWLVTLELSMAYIAGAFTQAPASLSKCVMDLKSFSGLLAHVTGFAAINAGCALQEYYFSESPAMSFMAPCILYIFLWATLRITAGIRTAAIMDDGYLDDHEVVWEKETEDAQKEIIGLGVSYVFVVSIRYAISGTPDTLKKEAPSDEHGLVQATWLFGIGLVFAVSSFYSLRKGWHERWDHDSPKYSLINTFYTALKMVIEIVAMSTCWCFIYATRWAIAANRGEQFDTDHTLLCLLTAVVLSAVAFGVIFVIDSIADKFSEIGESQHTIDALRETITMCGVLIGFSWESTFEVSEDALAESCDYPRVARMLLGLLSVGILIPAWRWHLLPMVHQHGWKFGIVVDTILERYGTLEQFEKVVMDHYRDLGKVHKHMATGYTSKEVVRRAARRTPSSLLGKAYTMGSSVSGISGQ